MGWRILAVAESLKKNDISVTDRLARILLGLDGGPGSGNYGHAGRPGKVGGSAKGSGGSSFRSGSKESGYSSFTKHKTFQGIASNARAAKNKNEFVHNLNKEQRDALTEQFFACGADMGEGHLYLGQYADRIYDMLHNRKGSEIRQKNKPVNGKDISQTWRPTLGSFNGESTKAIDTDIEDVLHKQGFDGVPKIVSHSEFERITREHPEMPILMRSYTGATQEQANEFDNDLEHGWFYVDCGTGGAGFGQGMYAAGIYNHQPRSYKDGEYYFHPNEGKYIKDDLGRTFEVSTRQWGMDNFVIRDPDDGDKYIFTKEHDDGTIDSDMLEAVDLGELGVCWRNMNTGEILDGGLWMSDKYDAFQDIEEITPEAIKKESLKGAKREMLHYRNLGVNRLMQEGIAPTPPEGKSLASYTDSDGEKFYYFYDSSEMKPFRDDPYDTKITNAPESGRLVVVGDPNSDFYKRHGGVVYRVDGEKLVPPSYPQWSLAFNDLDGTDAWCYLGESVPAPKLDPVPVTRIMTLDPSAKIITYDELKNIQNKSYDIRGAAKEKREEELKEFIQSLPFENAFFEGKIYSRAMGELKTGTLSDETIKKIDEYRKNNPDRMGKLQELVDRHIAEKEAAEKEASKYDHIRMWDEGVLAAALGYDAINASGHGESGSYTVVLNRTKLIISEDKVDFEE